MKRKPWKQATEDAIVRICRRTGTKIFDFSSLVRQELPQIVKETQTKGKTPEKSLSKYLQDLKERKIEFVDYQGTYKLIDDDLVARCSR